VLKMLIATVFFAHGVGHILFLAPALRLATWADQTGHSWAITPLFGDGLTRLLGGLIWGSATVLFIGAAAGLVAGGDWWRVAAVAGAVISTVGILVMWDGIATSNAVMALIVDLLVLAALVLAHWPSVEAVGS